MITTIKIKPVRFHIWVADTLSYQLVSLDPGVNATWHYVIDGQDGMARQGDLVMGGEDYQKWNDDLPYIEKWILAQLVLSLPDVTKLTKDDTFEEGD